MRNASAIASLRAAVARLGSGGHHEGSVLPDRDLAGMEETLHHGGLGAVVMEMSRLTMSASRGRPRAHGPSAWLPRQLLNASFGSIH